MHYVVDRFVKYVLQYPDMDINEVFNRFVYLLSDEELEHLSEMFPLLMSAGEAARSASPCMQQKLKKAVMI